MTQKKRDNSGLIFRAADHNSAAILRLLQRGVITPSCLEIADAAAITSESLAGLLDDSDPVELHALAQAIAAHFHGATLTMQAYAAVQSVPRCDLSARILENLCDSAVHSMRAIRALVR